MIDALIKRGALKVARPSFELPAIANKKQAEEALEAHKDGVLDVLSSATEEDDLLRAFYWITEHHFARLAVYQNDWAWKGMQRIVFFAQNKMHGISCNVLFHEIEEMVDALWQDQERDVRYTVITELGNWVNQWLNIQVSWDNDLQMSR